MASTRIIEEERGTYTDQGAHGHNGYFAGSFETHRRATAGPARPWSPAGPSGRTRLTGSTRSR